MTAPASEHNRFQGLRLKQLSAGFGATRVVRNVELEVPSGDVLVVLGESGCGKTTLLRAIAGLIPIESGSVELFDSDVTNRQPHERGVIYLDQEPLLFEHLALSENIAFSLRMKRQPESMIQESVAELLSATDLTAHANKRDKQLSGGQKQRAAFARAIVARPRLLLLDEPFCSLDSRTRGQMQSLFARLSEQYALTSIFVTHDIREALVVGNRFARMSAGALHVYANRREFVADSGTGIPDEIAFWNGIGNSSDETP